MKVASFLPQVYPQNYYANWQGFLKSAETCLSTDFDMIVVDAMQNGGGYVCLGLRLLQLLVPEYFHDNTRVQMKYDLPHSPFMDERIAKKNILVPTLTPTMLSRFLIQKRKNPS